MTREVVQIIDKETGDVNNLRDKKLADSTIQQQSGSASTDSVVMKTTGGDYVEIARDSFVGAIKSVMDGLIKGNSYTTLGANDPIAAFNSNALGGITPANLASVLGVPVGLGGAISKSATTNRVEIPNSTQGGFLVYKFGDNILGTHIIKYYHTFSTAVGTYGQNTLYVERLSTGGNASLSFNQGEGIGTVYFIYLPFHV